MNAEPPSGPFVNPGEEPPGRFVDGVWQGELDWCTRQGPAIVQWSVGLPTFVWNARDAAGNRFDLSHVMRPGVFRRTTADGFEHGRVEISAEDVVFKPNASESDLDEDMLPLFDALAADAAFMRDLKEAAFAAALYAALENEEFLDASGTRGFEFGQRGAARFVASLRNNGEIYLDYAWGRGPSFDNGESKRVQAHLTRLGVRPRPLEGERDE